MSRPNRAATAPPPLSPRTFAVVLWLVAASTVFLDYWEYRKSFLADPDIWAVTLRGNSPAPVQYRIGVLAVASLLERHVHLAMRYGLTLIDFAALLAAAFLLRGVLRRTAAWQAANATTRWFGAAAFVLLLQYSLLWLTRYQRPETLPTAALLAASLYLTAHGLPVRGASGKWLTALSVIGLALALGFIRPDAAVAFHCGVALACLLPERELAPAKPAPWSLARWPQLATSLTAAAIAGATQLYLMRAVYPQATYGVVKVLQLRPNIIHHLRLFPFLLFLPPTGWLVLQVARGNIAPTRAERGLLLGSGLFFLLWCVFGMIDEVRIFLPFALLVMPLTVAAAMRRIESGVPSAADIAAANVVS